MIFWAGCSGPGINKNTEPLEVYEEQIEDTIYLTPDGKLPIY